MLYQQDVAGGGAEVNMATFFDNLADEALDARARRFAEHLFRGATQRIEELDGLIRAGVDNWRVERMAVVDRIVIRLALFELLDDPSTPAAVILDEAIELAKAFGGQESGAFVNGVADGIRRRLDRGELKRG